MRVLEGNNVRELYKIGMDYLHSNGIEEDSRNGKVLVAPGPVMSVYRYPNQRVILNEKRNANPFFHFFEGIWMLSGGWDGTYLNQFVSDFTERFSDGKGYLHGAYGNRWRNHFRGDQIQSVVQILRENPNDRRAVINMWDPDIDLGIQSKDIPCNTSLFFRVTWGRLDMMVNCRSNDIIWGAYGANAVHMTMLQEYIAAAIEVELGTFYQNSWNFHAYSHIFDDKYTGVSDGTWCAPYGDYTIPLVTNPSTFLTECRFWVLGNDRSQMKYENVIFELVAEPMMNVHELYKTGPQCYDSALWACRQIIASDWREACIQWLKRKKAQHEIRRDAGEVNYESRMGK